MNLVFEVWSGILGVVHVHVGKGGSFLGGTQETDNLVWLG